MKKVQFIHDTNPETPIEIKMYLHCSKCIEEQPSGISPQDWSMVQIGWTAKGFQVVCNRHNCNVTNVEVKAVTK